VAVTVIATAVSGLGLVVAAAEAPAATSGDRAALYAAVSAVLVALIGGAVAILTRRPEPPAVRYVDPPTSNALPAELADLAVAERRRLDDALTEIRELRAEVDMWQDRAYQAGWRP